MWYCGIVFQGCVCCHSCTLTAQMWPHYKSLENVSLHILFTQLLGWLLRSWKGMFTLSVLQPFPDVLPSSCGTRNEIRHIPSCSFKASHVQRRKTAGWFGREKEQGLD